MPEAPVISIAAIAPSDQGDEGSTSEGSSIGPGDQPGDKRSTARPHSWSGPHAGRDGSDSGGAFLLSQLRRR